MPENLLTRNNVSLQSGSNPYGPFARPDGMSAFEIILGRCTTATPNDWDDPATTALIQIQYSYDGGQTWTPPEANQAGPVAGGVKVYRGEEIPEWVAGFKMDPLPTHIMGDIIVANGPLRTSVRVEAVENF
jgi:hypothetical protein